MRWMMRWIRKALILALAGLGAYRLYELVSARAGRVQTNAGPQVSDAVETVKTAAARVKDDVTAAKSEVAEELRSAAEEPLDLVEVESPGEPEPRMAVADEIGDGARRS
jgi:hypothetical protein